MAPCELYCGVCGVYIATRDRNEKFKAVMGSLYGTKPEETECLGCMQPDPPKNLYGFCKGCTILLGGDSRYHFVPDSMGLDGHPTTSDQRMPPCLPLPAGRQGRAGIRFSPASLTNPKKFVYVRDYYQSYFSLEQRDFKGLTFVRAENMGRMDLHDLYAIDYGPLGGDRAVDHGEAL
jgi:hypothetical protein